MRMKRLGIVCVALMLLICGCQGGGEDAKQYSYTMENGCAVTTFGDVTLRFDPNYLEEEEENRIAEKVEHASEAADRFFPADYVKATAESGILCEVRAGAGATGASGHTITIYYAENDTVPYIALMTQVKAGLAGVPDWLREGLGVYAAELEGESLMDTGARWIEEIQALKKEEEKPDLNRMASALFSVSSYTGAAQLGDLSALVLSTENAEEAYNLLAAYDVFAGSFVRYLDQTYGREALLRIYRGEAMENVTGVSRDAALAQWRAGIQ